MDRLFVDMDGTLAVFSYVKNIEELYQKGYFDRLKPMANVIKAIKYIIEEVPKVEVSILSSYLQDSKFALAEKQKWLDRYLPELKISNRIFIPYQENKASILRDLSRNDYLLDDYTPNLVSWSKKGTAIKLVNEINDTTGLWQGFKLHYNDSHLADKLIHIFHRDNGAVNISDDIEGQLMLNIKQMRGN